MTTSRAFSERLTAALRSGQSGTQDGMTLIEMLIVLAIIAVTASIAVLSIGGGSGRAGQAEARRLENRLQLAADRSMLDDEAIALVARADGYRFVQWDADKRQWLPSPVALLAEPHALPRGITLQASDPSGLLPLGADAGGQAFELTIEADGRSWVIGFDGVTATTGPTPPATTT